MESAGILFCDVVGYTDACAREPPLRVLRSLYSALDHVARENRVHKVSAVGDEYMAAAFGPHHLTGLVQAGLDMRSLASNIRWLDGRPVTLRAGIHCGPLAVARLGDLEARYGMFGSTVNVAKRIETAAAPGDLTLSQAVVDALREQGAVLDTREDTVLLKGLGATVVHTATGDRLRRFGGRPRRPGNTPDPIPREQPRAA